MLSNKSMALYTAVVLITLVVLIAVLYVWFYEASDKVAESAQPEPTSLQKSGQTVSEASTMAASAPSEITQTPPPAVTLLSPQQAQIVGLDLAKDPQTNELLREVEAMNQAIEQRLAAPTIEERQQADMATTAQAEALALIRQVDAQYGMNSLALADQQFEQSQITDPELQQIISEGQQLEDEIATIAQGLQ